MGIIEFKKDTIEETILYKKTRSGLNVYFMPKRGYTKKYAIFSTNYGSTDNVFVPIGEKEEIILPEGVAHFLEHKLFEEPDTNIFNKFSMMGAEVNAFTSFNQTSYLFYSTDHFYENLELLIKFVQNPYLTDENIEKEKGIIEQEINMYKDNPGWRVYFNLLKAMYVKHPVRMDIAGTIESINTINKDVLEKSYNTFYNPSNMVLFLIGDLSFDEIIDVVEKSERKFTKREDSINRILPVEPKKIGKAIVEENMFTAAPLFNIGFKDQDLNQVGAEKVKKDMVTNILLDILFGPSSTFYNNLYGEGLIDNSFGSYFTGKDTYGHSLIVGQSSEPELVYEKIVELINKPVDEVIKLEDFLRIKRKNLGEFLMSLNSIEFIANNFTDFYFDDFLILDYLELLESTEFHNITDRFNNHLIEDYLVLSMIKPIRE